MPAALYRDGGVEWNRRRGGTRRPPPLPAGSLHMGANHGDFLTTTAEEESPAIGARARGRGSRPPPAGRRAEAAAAAARASLDAMERAIAGVRV